MKRFNIELPKYRLELGFKLTKRRKPLVEEPILPTIKTVNKKYRTGTTVGKIARYITEHKNVRKYFAANMAALALIGTFSPLTQNSVQAADDNNVEPIVIQTQNTLITEKSIQFPLDNIKINQGFNIFHPGVDLGAEVGTPIKAIKSGIIIEVAYDKFGYGNTVLIDHGHGLTSRYAHLSKIEVALGDNVTTFTKVGEVGTTGRSTGPHLHLEIRQDGIAINPLSVLSK